MGKWFMALVAALVLSETARAQEAEEMLTVGNMTEGIEVVMRFMGVDSPEELHAAEVERLEDFLDRPLRINMVATSRLASSGLLSPFQVASLADYRSRHGNVVSYAELAASSPPRNST